MTFQEQLQFAVPLGVAALGGLAVGIEREWSAKKGEDAPRFAGVRTFLLIGLIGALSVELMQSGAFPLGVCILAGAAALIVIAYAAIAFQGSRDSTTEFAAIVVLASGVLAGTGKLALASAINAFTALVLVEKTRIHSLVYRLESEELQAGLRFAVLALVVLPLLPEGPYGPAPGFRPRELWALVLLFSGLSFVGYVARRAVGVERGYKVAGLLGGIISSTLVTLNFSRDSRIRTASGVALAAGVIAACTVLPFRVGLVTTILNRTVGLATLPFLVLPFLIGFLIFMLFSRNTVSDQQAEMPSNPLGLFTAIKMVVLFQTALYVLNWASARYSSGGVLFTAALVGFADMDTLTFMIAKQGILETSVAVQALVIGLFSNTILKLILALVIGKGKFRLYASLGLALLAAVTILSLFLF